MFSGRPRAVELAGSSLRVDFPSSFHSLLYMGCNCHRSIASRAGPSSASYIQSSHSRTRCFAFSIGRWCPVLDPLWSSHSLPAVWSPSSTPSCRSWLHHPPCPPRQTIWPWSAPSVGHSALSLLYYQSLQNYIAHAHHSSSPRC